MGAAESSRADSLPPMQVIAGKRPVSGRAYIQRTERSKIAP